MRCLIVAGILIFFAWCAPVHAGDKVTIAEQGKTIVEAKSKYLKIKATFTASPVKSEPYAPFFYRRSCIENVEIMANGKQLAVPRSVYLDICNASEAEVVLKKKRLSLKYIAGTGPSLPKCMCISILRDYRAELCTLPYYLINRWKKHGIGSARYNRDITIGWCGF